MPKFEAIIKTYELVTYTHKIQVTAKNKELAKEKIEYKGEYKEIAIIDREATPTQDIDIQEIKEIIKTKQS